MTACHLLVKHQKNRLKCGTWGISGPYKSKMEFILNIDAILISYAYMMTSCHSFVKLQNNRFKCGTWGISGP